MRSILALRALGLGDVLAVVPALRAIRRSRPADRLVLAGPAEVAELLLLDGLLDDCLPARGLERQLDWSGAVDTALNLHGCGPQSHTLLAARQPRELVAFACGDFSGPRWREEEHERRRWCRLVSEWWGIESDPDDVALMPPIGESPRPQAIVLHPGAAHGARRWPADRWAEVARSLIGQSAVVVTGARSEARLAREVARKAGLGLDHVLAGHTSVPELASLVARARLVLSGDTGIAHLATAYATPSVTLFGPTPPARWGPGPVGPHEVLFKGSGQRDARADQVDPALLEITVPEVLDAAERVLRRN